MNQAMNDILLNLSADLIAWLFIVILSIAVWWLWHGRVLVQARQFFCIDQQTQIQVYVSAHEDKETSTKDVITAEEFMAAIELNNTLEHQFRKRGFIYDAVVWVSGLLSFPLKYPELVVRVSPRTELSAWPTLGSHILIGGPVRNQVTKFYLKTGNPWITFDEAEEKFLICRGERTGERLDPSDNLAILEKMIIGGKAMLAAFGFGERGTRSAVQYLADNWMKLNQRYQDGEFGICLSVDDKGKAEVLLELPVQPTRSLSRRL